MKSHIKVSRKNLLLKNWLISLPRSGQSIQEEIWPLLPYAETSAHFNWRGVSPSREVGLSLNDLFLQL